MNRFKCRGIINKIGKETEIIFNEYFWTNQDLIISAEDNVEARDYLNSKFHKFNKILMNLGTSGVRAKAEIIIPKITYPLQIEKDTSNEY